jgi:tRNA (adenine37-N6)-methyltransferase
MVIEMSATELKAIGIVKNNVNKWVGVTKSKDVVSEIILNDNLVEGLRGLEGFSHATIIFWMPRPPGPLSISFHPGHKADLPLVGVFASRSPARPNPIAKTIVEIIEYHNNTLRVKGLDAVDGTPVIDIVPYMPQSDSIDNARVPAWVSKIHKSLQQLSG